MTRSACLPWLRAVDCSLKLAVVLALGKGFTIIWCRPEFMLCSGFVSIYGWGNEQPMARDFVFVFRSGLHE